MFFCEQCRKERNWPGLVFASRGPCEICGNIRDCYDVQSSALPLPKETNVSNTQPTNTISIIPTGLYNAALKRQGIKLEMVDAGNGSVDLASTDGTRLDPSAHISDLVNRVCELDVILGMVVQSNADKLMAKTSELRQLFESGDVQVSGTISASGASGNYEDDDFDDFIAEMRASVDSIRGVIADHYKQVQG